MPIREIYEPLTDDNGNQVFDEQGIALTVLVRTEDIPEEEEVRPENTQGAPMPTKAELLDQVNELLKQINALKE